MDGFTLDPDTGKFLHTHKDIRIPSAGPIYSFNEANFHDFEEPVKRYLDALKEGSSSVGIRYVDADAIGAYEFVPFLFPCFQMPYSLPLTSLITGPTLDTLVHWSGMFTTFSRTVVSTDILAPFPTRMVSCDCCTNRRRCRSLWSRPVELARPDTGEFST